ncbi:MAG: metallophosphoesterase [Spirochaetales bacterium]|nr:metallophosphoesterase [Spirochaetales bacterium]
MKILCISDHIDSIIYSMQIKCRYKDIDLVISAGDLRLSYYDFIMSNLNKPLYFVFGNHKLNGIEYYKKEYRRDIYSSPLWNKLHFKGGATHIDQKIKRYKNLFIAGLGGSLWYNGGGNQFTEAGMFLKMIKLLPGLIFNKIVYGRFIDILVTHSPPYGIHDKEDRCHRGFKVFLLFMRLFKPRYLIHGHIHLYNVNENRIDKYLDTLVVNAYNHHTIEIREGI